MKWTLPLSLIVLRMVKALSRNFFPYTIKSTLNFQKKIVDTRVHNLTGRGGRHLACFCPGESTLIYVHFQCRLRSHADFSGVFICVGCVNFASVLSTSCGCMSVQVRTPIPRNRCPTKAWSPIDIALIKYS